MDLPTYTNIWRIEKRLYKLYDLRLPMPLPVVWIGVFVGVSVPWWVFLYLIGLPFAAPWHVIYLVPPGVLTWLSTRPVIENKRLTELLQSQLRYMSEPRTWCRMAPYDEPDEVVFTARVWRTTPPAAAPGGAARKARRKVSVKVPVSKAAKTGVRPAPPMGPRPAPVTATRADAHQVDPSRVVRPAVAAAAAAAAPVTAAPAAPVRGGATARTGAAGERVLYLPEPSTRPGEPQTGHVPGPDRERDPHEGHGTHEAHEGHEPGPDLPAHTVESSVAGAVESAAPAETSQAPAVPPIGTEALRRLRRLAASAEPRAVRPSDGAPLDAQGEPGSPAQGEQPTTAEAPRPEAAQSEAVRSEAARSEPTQAEAAQQEAAQAEMAQAEVAQSVAAPAADDQAHDEPAHDEPAHDEPAHGESAHDQHAPAEGSPEGPAVRDAHAPAESAPEQQLGHDGQTAAEEAAPAPVEPAGGAAHSSEVAHATPRPETAPSDTAKPVGTAQPSIPQPDPEILEQHRKGRPPRLVRPYETAARGAEPAEAAGTARGVPTGQGDVTSPAAPAVSIQTVPGAAGPAGLAGPSLPTPGRITTGRPGNEEPPRLRRVEAVVGRDPSGGWRRLAQVVVGGSRTDGMEIDEARARTPLTTSRRIMVLGCTGGAGQTTTALMLGHTLARYREDRVLALDANTGEDTLTTRIATESPETLSSLIESSDEVNGYLGMRAYTTRCESGLEVVGADTDDRVTQRLAERAFLADWRRTLAALDRHYRLTVIDPAAALAARLLPYADQLVLVAPASEDASEAVAMTYEWLDGHGCSDLRRRAVMVINGVSRRSLPDVEQAEAVASGRCRAIVRVPWEDELAPGRPGPVDVIHLRTGGRRAYVALAGVIVSGLAAVQAKQEVVR
ncbi:hypothetical protein GCM10010116_18290 [Microbispora rosea subsp. aerata]|nr:TcpE family conjugal transfer membrane protein [Microbispora rosea]GGO09021.1 hypothetical protein GCM10010116_18290 [Microbispora rosea subsp. aerata]GIH55289.1 hypothetical protein Mro02_22030 [Microbispora rosea subsp. aerata]GLJ86614.1 hypothetical protein GCM10017588_53520 [Microbispora rosea subsp. aerata]